MVLRGKPFTQRKLASNQRSLGVQPEVGSANSKAVIAENFAGMRVLTATTLASYTTGTGADRAGTPVCQPHRDLCCAQGHHAADPRCDGVPGQPGCSRWRDGDHYRAPQAELVYPPAGSRRTGAVVLWSGTVVETVTLNGSGAGNLVVTGPAIYEATGQYNTVASAPISGDVITLGGAASTPDPAQPVLAQAGVLGWLRAHQKLHSTDTLATTKDGLQLRVSKRVLASWRTSRRSGSTSARRMPALTRSLRARDSAEPNREQAAESPATWRR